MYYKKMLLLIIVLFGFQRSFADIATQDVQKETQKLEKDEKRQYEDALYMYHSTVYGAGIGFVASLYAAVPGCFLDYEPSAYFFIIPAVAGAVLGWYCAHSNLQRGCNPESLSNFQFFK